MKRISIITFFTTILLLHFGSAQGQKNKGTDSSQETDTVIIDENNILFIDQGSNMAEGRVNGTDLRFMTRSREDSLYQYVFGDKKLKSENGDSVQVLTILLRKNKEILSEINFQIDFRFMDPGSFRILEKVKIKDVDKTINFGFGRPACGYAMHDVLFFRKNDQLIPGILLTSEGEMDNPYDLYAFVPPKNHKENEIWVEHREGHFLGVEEYNFYTGYEKYIFANDSLELLNPVDDNFQYVIAKSGVKLRNSPISDKYESSSAGTLPFGTKVNVRNETDLSYSVIEKGKEINGKWLRVEYARANDRPFPGYIFSGYLSKINPGKK